MPSESPENSPVVLRLSKSEALVLFEWLARSNETEQLRFENDAEQVVLWRLEGLLESTLVEPFLPDYKEIVARAWARINDPKGDGGRIDAEPEAGQA